MSGTRGSVLCLSHLRWNGVFQRPQHLLVRCARDHEVVFFEEPIFGAERAALQTSRDESGVIVATPQVPGGLAPRELDAALCAMIDQIVAGPLSAARPVLWYYTPMALPFTHQVRAQAVVYDCMDELSLVQGAPPDVVARERLLFDHADVVFAGGHSLCEHKRATSAHRNIHAFPSSVDAAHFARARGAIAEPADQIAIPPRRVGYFGIIDARLDLALLAELADARPDLQLVMIGPIVKIDPASLPRRANLHWLGAKRHAELPAYIAHWDVAMMPFARNDSTRFISPTKTPEYLAAGRPVVATPITDVVTPYGRDGLAWIADSAPAFAAAIDEALACDRGALRARADAFLADRSWDDTWRAMWALVERASALAATSASCGFVRTDTHRAAG